MRSLQIVEFILRSRDQFFVEVREGKQLGQKLKSMIIASLLCLLVYGAVLGSSHSALQALSSAIKLPILFLVTLVLTGPTLYFFSVLFGSNQTLTQSLVLLMTAITVTSVLLLSFAPITLFFLLSTSSYQLFKLLNVLFFIIAGFRGVRFLGYGMRIVSQDEQGLGQRHRLLWFWVALYGLVGSQLAWTLRPFVGAPGLPFELFRGFGGTFFANILVSFGELLGL